MKNKKVLFAIGIILAIGIVVFCWNRQLNGARRIGMLSILSGEFSKVGRDALNGAKMYVDDYNSSHGESTIVLEVEDGKAEARSSASGFMKLTSRDVQGCIVVGDNQALSVAGMAVEKRMPTIVCSTGTSAFLAENKTNDIWIVKYSSAVASEASSLAVYAKSKLAITNVSLLTMEGGFGNDSGNAFTTSFVDAGGTIKTHETFASTANETRPQVLKILADDPDAIYVSGYGISYLGAINQIREAGYKKVILTTDCISTPYAKEVIKEFDSILYSGFVINRTQSYMDFEKKYYDKYHELPTRDSVYGYDSAALLCEALDGVKDPEQLVSFILNHSNVHLAGAVQFFANGDTIFPISFIWAKTEDNE